MGQIKKYDEFVKGMLDTSTLNIEEISSIFEDGIKKAVWWESIKKKEFKDIPFLAKEDFGFKVDIMIDGTKEYKNNKHEPCIWFCNGKGDMDFLPMVLCSEPYIPYPFVQNVTDDELLWVYEFVRKHRLVLLKHANDKISSKDLFKHIDYSQVNENEDKTGNRIGTNTTGLRRYIWVGPYDKSHHYLRIKIQTPKSSGISEEWASISIPDLNIENGRGEYDLSGKEEFAAKRFSMFNKEVLDDFANKRIGYKTLAERLIKVDKKGNPDAGSIGDIEYVNSKDGKYGFTIVENIKNSKGKFGVKNKDGILVTKDWFDEIEEFHKKYIKKKGKKTETIYVADAILNKKKCKLYGDGTITH